MRILYGYSNCTDALYNRLMSENRAAVLQPDQKYHGLLIKGLAKNGAEVQCLSGLPINRSVTKKKWIHEPDEQVGAIHYHYYRTINLPGLRQVMIFLGGLWNSLRRKSDYAICDCLNIANAYGILLGAHLRKTPVVLIVTDIPDMQYGSERMRNIANRLFDLADGFILLTEQMNQRINRKRKPHIVLEGHVDADAEQVLTDEKYEAVDGKKVVLYAGSLLKLYGIQNLVEGFLQADRTDAELWIYGDGDYREELERISEKYPQIQYKGVRDNQTVVDAEMKAALLVNPRPSAPEYTKYSFPSKNMEYMVSGTPVLTTKLPGMPEPYYPFIYLLEDESKEGISGALKSILSEKRSVREAKGKSAREFVLTRKSNVVQSKKMIDFLSGNYDAKKK